MSESITVSVIVSALPESLWGLWTTPEHICNWNFASAEWHNPSARNDLRPGGSFSYRMEARDGSMGFDFEGTWTLVEPHSRLECLLGDRTLVITFEAEGEGTRVSETFTPDNEVPAEMQRAGWQAILDNFKAYAESL